MLFRSLASIVFFHFYFGSRSSHTERGRQGRELWKRRAEWSFKCPNDSLNQKKQKPCDSYQLVAVYSATYEKIKKNKSKKNEMGVFVFFTTILLLALFCKLYGQWALVGNKRVLSRKSKAALCLHKLEPICPV